MFLEAFLSQKIELEIQSLLKDYGDAAVAADRLMQYAEANPDLLANSEDMESLAKFLINAGFLTSLRDFCARHLTDDSFACPWPFLIEALALLGSPLDELQKKALEKGVRELGLQKELGRSTHGEKLLPEVSEYRNERRYRLYRSFLDNKQEMIEQLAILRVQGLVEKENELLKRIQRLYPGDKDVIKATQEHKQRYAFEVLSRHSSRIKKNSRLEEAPVEPEVLERQQDMSTSLTQLAKENPHLAYDLAIVAYSLDAYAAGLDILENAEAAPEALWLRMEFLLKERRWLELLSEISVLESKFAHEPETFFATAYLRAQALWGLGQKHTAIEVMEGLLAARPQYRAGLSILESWRSQ